MNDITKLYAIGCQLEDIKTTLRHDMKIDISGLKISGRGTEAVTVPRYAVKILEESDLVTYDQNNMVTELKQALSKEKMIGQNQLAILYTSFYIKLVDTLQTLDRHDYDRVKSMMNELARIRRGKLIKMADSTHLTRDLSKRLTVEEREFYKSIRHTSSIFEQRLDHIDKE